MLTSDLTITNTESQEKPTWHPRAELSGNLIEQLDHTTTTELTTAMPSRLHIDRQHPSTRTKSQKSKPSDGDVDGDKGQGKPYDVTTPQGELSR